MSTASVLKMDIISYVLEFFPPSERASFAEINQHWREGTVLRLRSDAFCAMNNFTQLLFNNSSESVRDNFFTHYSLGQINIDGNRFFETSGFRDIQSVAETIQRKIASQLLSSLRLSCERNEDFSVELDKSLRPQDVNFNYGFENIFKIMLYEDSVERNAASGVDAGCEMELLTSDGCGVSALHLISKHFGNDRLDNIYPLFCTCLQLVSCIGQRGEGQEGAIALKDRVELTMNSFFARTECSAVVRICIKDCILAETITKLAMGNSVDRPLIPGMRAQIQGAVEQDYVATQLLYCGAP